MERLTLKLRDAGNALETLEAILKEPYTVIVRDAAIQRFEYTFEAVWKCIKEYLKVKEGVVCNSPKSCFRELLSLGILSDDETVNSLEMTDRRNDTAHTYKEEVAQAIFDSIQQYYQLMSDILQKAQKKL
jgi:nucleotidyltransferase substrate binding protein (TIGR01987 family)